jgi:AraC-like DNA-binding protein
MKVMFSTNTVHARDRLEYWREEASKAYVAHEFDSEVGRSFRGKIHAGALGPLELAVFDCDPCRVERTALCLKRTDDDGVIIGMQIAGSMGVRQDGREFVAKADDLYLIDPRRPFALDVRGDARSMVVKAPRGEVTARLGDTTSLTARPISGRKPVGSLAAGFIAMLGARVDAIKGPAATKIAQQALDLVALAFDEDVNGMTPRLSSPRTTTALRLKSTIEVLLHNPELKPPVAAAAVGISVRYANALLSQEGTSLERYIMTRRLEHCHRALIDPGQMFRTVTDIAYSCGFSDVSHFTRRFKSRFGCSPSECRPRTR